MQTPGRQVLPQTPMIPMERRTDSSSNTALQKITEEVKNIERPQVRVLGRIISLIEDNNNSMRAIRQQIREDVRAKRNFYRDEAKLLKKDSDNLSTVKASLFTNLRRGGAAIAAASGVAALRSNNIGGALSGFGLAGALLSPEIVEFLTGSVVNVLALKGFIGNRGAGTSNVAGGVVRGSSRTRNPLLLTAALAASFLIPALAKSSQTGDQRRQELATRVITGEQTINKPDVARFRSQLARFDRILTGISRSDEKDNVGVIDFNELEKSVEKNKGVELNPEEDAKKNEDNFFQKIGNFFNFNREPEEIEEEKNNDDKISFLQGDTNIDLSSNLEGDTTFENREGDTTIEGDNLRLDNSKISLLQTNSSENITFNDQISNIFESNVKLSSDLLPNLSITQMSQQMVGESTNNIIGLQSNDDGEVRSSGFKGITAVAPEVAVSTKFTSGGGAIDRFEAASSLRSYGVFS